MIEKFTNFFIFILNKFCDFYFKRQHHSKFFRKSVVLFCLKFSLNLLQYETKQLISKKILIHAKFTEESGLYFFPKYYLINHKKNILKSFIHPFYESISLSYSNQLIVRLKAKYVIIHVEKNTITFSRHI